MRVVSERGVPPVGSHHVRRARLTRILDESSAQATVLTAPAGYGKTTLVSEWLSERPLVAWYRATASSADVAAFSVGIAEVVAPFVPGAGTRLRHRLRVAEAPEQALRPLAELLAEDLNAWPEDARLVVDDYHLVADSPAVEQFVDWLLTLAPIRLVVMTRRRPSWASARRILHGEVAEITGEELAMTDEEASRVLAGVSGENVRAFVAQAQGWPALIGLARISASLKLPTSRVSSALFRYFAEEVFQREPPEVQSFMLASAVPTGVDPETSRSVLGIEAPTQIIERLADEGLLREVEPGDFRFHPLLRDFLRRKFEAETPDLFVSVANCVIDNAREHARWDEAIELALDLGDRNRAAEILTEAAPGLLDAGRIETIERWLADCGPATLEHPTLLTTKADILLRRGELVEAAALACDVARRLPPNDERCSRAWSVAGRAFLHVSDYDLALECLAKARETARTDEEAAMACVASAAVASEFGGDRLGGLAAEVERLTPESLEARLNLASSKIMLAAQGRSLTGAWKAVEPFVALVQNVSDPVVRSFFLELAGYVANSRADYRRGWQLAQDALHTCHDFRLGRIRTAYSLCFRAAAAIGLRRFGEARSALREISQLDIAHAKHLLGEKRNVGLKLLLAQRQFDRALDSATLSERTGVPTSFVAERTGLIALAAAARGSADGVQVECEKADGLEGVEAYFYPRFAMIVRRIATFGSTDTVRRDAIELFWETHAAEMLDAFVIAYRAYPPLLRLVAEDESALPIVRTVVEAANDRELAAQAGIPLPEDEPRERRGLLTPREAEVLGLIEEGLSNAEIAARLVVSEATVKVHVHHILEKLGAKSRLHAVLMSK